MIPKGCRIPSKFPVRHKRKPWALPTSGKPNPVPYIITKMKFLESCRAAEPDILKEYGME